MIFLNPTDLFTYLIQATVNAERVDIASYGMYLNITLDADWQKKFPSETRQFIDLVAAVDHRIVIGLPYYMPCKDNCPDCKKKYNLLLQRHKHTKEKLNLNIRWHPKLHMKYYRISRNCIICGGINLTKSDFVDCAIKVRGWTARTKLEKQYEKLWSESSRNITGFYK